VLLAPHAVLGLAAGIERGTQERIVAEPGRVQPRGLERDFGEPDASTLLAVPVKYLSTNSRTRPTASKICAPQWDWYVEMPILTSPCRVPC
jgi:hypothetical protein